MNRQIQLATFASTPLFKATHSRVLNRISWIDFDGTPEPVLLLAYSDFVGWIRIVDSHAIWRYGSLRTKGESFPRRLTDLTRDEGRVLVVAISEAIREVAPEWPMTEPPEGEVEGFIRKVESRATRAYPSQILPSMPSVARGSGPTDNPPPTTSAPIEFSYLRHSTDRYPAASGFTEESLNNVPLVTVHPAAIPAAIGAIFMMMAGIGGSYEMFVAVRWAVTAMAIWMSIIAGSQKRTLWVAIFVILAILFNPFIPIYATREFWKPIDLAGIVLFVVAGVKLRASRPATE